MNTMPVVQVHHLQQPNEATKTIYDQLVIDEVMPKPRGEYLFLDLNHCRAEYCMPTHKHWHERSRKNILHATTCTAWSSKQKTAKRTSQLRTQGVLVKQLDLQRVYQCCAETNLAEYDFWKDHMANSLVTYVTFCSQGPLSTIFLIYQTCQRSIFFQNFQLIHYYVE